MQFSSRGARGLLFSYRCEPPREADAPEDARSFVYLQPEPGTVLMWESWLRHEVPANAARKERISVSFNYAWR